MSDQRAATIFALSTAPGIGGIAVIRLSGPEVDRVLATVAGAPLPQARRASLRRIVAGDGEEIDEALVLRFEPPASYTGEPSAEIQCHGGRAVVAAVLDLLSRQDGLRPADPGEFTRRAFTNGRLDLTEVEALGDLLSAETEAQRRFAMRGARGALRVRAEDWRRELLAALTLLEVTIDWADEEVPEDVAPQVRRILEPLAMALERELEGFAVAERLRQGFEVALIGAPNAGKSTLLNALAGREAAITAASPGTTRDVLEVHLDLGGLPVTVLDTAGIRDASDEVERIGVARALERAEAADLRLALVAPDAPLSDLVASMKADLVVATKADLGEGSVAADIAVSAVTGTGLDRLTALIAERLSGRVAAAGLIGHIRQRDAVAAALRAIRHSADRLDDPETEITAELLWQALRALEELAGRTGREELLSSVFGSFCLGK